MTSTGTSGYQHRDYANALSEFAEPIALTYSGGYLLKRQIVGTDFSDAAGCYPLFSCLDWGGLPADLECLKSELVSIVLVADPFGDVTADQLSAWFPDLSRPFKNHFIVDLSRRPSDFVAPHHRRHALRALASLAVDSSDNALTFLDDWVGLYDALIHRHQIAGLRAFSRHSFSLQLQVPGIRIFRALELGTCVGATLWYVQGDVAYYHLGSYSQRGYEVNASHAIFWRAIESFHDLGMRWLNLGGGAGLTDGGGGLTRFKRGWSTEARTAYICGRILDRKAYNTLCSARTIVPTADYFPVYRQGEIDVRRT